MKSFCCLVLAVTLAGSACGGDAEDESAATASGAAAGDTGGEQSHCVDGWIAGLGGEGQECAAMAGQCCYEDTDDACDALDCDGACNVDDGLPATVSCP